VQALLSTSLYIAGERPRFFPEADRRPVRAAEEDRQKAVRRNVGDRRSRNAAKTATEHGVTEAGPRYRTRLTGVGCDDLKKN
jgi:hypothetical protein